MSWYNDCGPVTRTQAERAGECAFERGGSEYGYPDSYPANRQRDFSYGYRAAQEEHMREEAARRDAAQRAERKRLDDEEEDKRYLDEDEYPGPVDGDRDEVDDTPSFQPVANC